MIREALADAVRSSGCAQKRLAALAGLSEKHVSRMMTGRATGTIPAWEALLRAADVKVTITTADHAERLAAITTLTTAALADRRRGCPTYGLVSAAQIQRIVESTNHAGDPHE